jgi:hypothetical protein
MINIHGEDYTIEQIEAVFNLSRELLEINENLNANIIAMNAKLLNEEKKVKDLQYKLFFLTQNTINKYEA